MTMRLSSDFDQAEDVARHTFLHIMRAIRQIDLSRAFASNLDHALAFKSSWTEDSRG